MIRRARPQDAAALAEINSRGWTFAYGEYVDVGKILAATGGLEERWREGLTDRHDPRHIWVAEGATGALEGFVSVGPSRDDDARVGVGELMAIYVATDVVATGVGRDLLARGEQSLRELGFTAATLWVFEANARARRFYERNGWTEEADSGPGPWGWAPSVRYRKALAS